MKFGEIAIPEPKDDEVLIKIKDCGISNTEIWMCEGAYGVDSKSGWREEGVKFPRILSLYITYLGRHVLYWLRI